MVASPSKSDELEAVSSLTRSVRLSAATMYARFVAGDPAWNGRFFTGVVTTGIYCLPSCKARKPKRENVRFFPTCEAARAGGFRACRKCHPDDFARGADPVLETVEAVVAEVRDHPETFRDARAVLHRLGFGTTRAFELFRQHYHATPADILLRGRLGAAKHRLLTSDVPLSEIALSVGFDALSAFHENFRAFNGLTPVQYRALRDADGFEIEFPRGYLLGYLRRALSRDTQSVSEKLEADRYTAAVQLRCGPAVLTLRLSAESVHASIAPDKSSRAAHDDAPAPAVEAHALIVGLLGLDEDAAAFARLARKIGVERLVAEREELRISRTASVWDGLVWSIIGQQINFAFACLLKRRLTEVAGSRLSNGLYAPPLPAQVAALDPAALLPLQFSKQKAAYLIGASEAVTSGALDLESLPHLSATRAERTLLSVRGLGPWSVNYVMMRALGFADCVPLGDTGVTSGLQALFTLDERPDVDATRRLMAVFSPYRSLATAHLWQLNKPIPT